MCDTTFSQKLILGRCMSSESVLVVQFTIIYSGKDCRIDIQIRFIRKHVVDCSYLSFTVA